MFDVSVIIPGFNRSDEFTMTLQSLCHRTLNKDCFEIVIADDGSSENIQMVLARFPMFGEQFTSWGGEDNDFGIQLCQYGANVQLCEEIKVVHYPTRERTVASLSDENFQVNYKKTKHYIAQKYLTPETLLWEAFGAKVCGMTEEQRSDALASLGGIS